MDTTAGSIIFCPPGMPVQFHAEGTPFQWFYSHFDILINRLPIRNTLRLVSFADQTLTLPGIPTIALFGQANEHFLKTFINWFLLSTDHLEIDACQLEYQIEILKILRILRLTHLKPTGREINTNLQIEQAVYFLHENMHRPLNLSEIATHIRVSKTTLKRIFQKHFSNNPMEYLAELRMQRACKLLRNQNLSVSEVAHECGYNSLPYFSRHFKKRCGVAPSNFRKR